MEAVFIAYVDTPSLPYVIWCCNSKLMCLQY